MKPVAFLIAGLAMLLLPALPVEAQCVDGVTCCNAYCCAGGFISCRWTGSTCTSAGACAGYTCDAWIDGELVENIPTSPQGTCSGGGGGGGGGAPAGCGAACSCTGGEGTPYPLDCTSCDPGLSCNGSLCWAAACDAGGSGGGGGGGGGDGGGSSCGDGSCNGPETCSNCSLDCGACTGNIRGTVYDDPNRRAIGIGGFCQLAGASGVMPGAGSTISVPGGYSGVVQGSGSYNVGSVPVGSGYTATLHITDDAYVCSCPSGCVYGGLTSPQSGVNFFVTQSKTAWFQTVGGSLHAETDLVDPVPDSALEPYVSLQDDLGTPNSAGLVTYGEMGGVDFSAQVGIQEDGIDEGGRDYLARSSVALPQQNYAYFYRRFEMGLHPSADDFGDPLHAAQPNRSPSDGKRAYYYQGDLTIDANVWNVGADESLTLFVDGTLTVRDEIHVAQGGFLAFIVSGDIRFDETLGSPDETSTAALVEGLFIADGVITVEGSGGSGDLKFVGEGTFVGWGGIVLGRDYDDGAGGIASNATYPVELFRYRPDLAINAPERFKKPVYTWQEVAP